MLSLLLALSPAALASVPSEVVVDLAATYKYAGPDQKQKDLDVSGIVAAILADPDGTHYVWMAGWSSWKTWQEVPEIKQAVEVALAPVPAAPPPLAPPMAAPLLSYSNGGEVLQLTAAEIAARVGSEPTGYHVAWKPGMDNWVPAAELPEVKAAMAGPAKSTSTMPAPTAAAPAMSAPPEAPPAKAEEPVKAPRKSTAKPLPGPEDKEKPIQLLKSFSGGAEVQASVPWMYRYVNAAGEVVESDPVGTTLHRGRLWFGSDLGSYASAKLAVNAEQVDDRSATTAGLTGVADGWAFSVPYGYADLHYVGKAFQVGARVGAQDVAIGANDYFDDYANYYYGGREHSASLESAFGVFPRNDLGLSLYTGSVDPLWKVELQMMNGSGVGSVDDNFGRLYLARATFMSPAIAGDWLHVNVWAGGYTEQKAVDNSVASTGASFAGEVRLKEYARVLGGLLVGGEGTKTDTGVEGYSHLGYQVAVAAGLPFERGAVERIEVVFTDQSYAPRVNDLDNPNGAYTVNVGANVYLNTGGRGTVLMGLAYENYIPIPLEENVLHTGVFQVAARY